MGLTSRPWSIIRSAGSSPAMSGRPGRNQACEWNVLSDFRAHLYLTVQPLAKFVGDYVEIVVGLEPKPELG